jgi:hypothetical protein
MVGLCLVAVFAIASIAATSASALPEFGKCNEKAGGKYSDSNCTTKASLKSPGTHEWEKENSTWNINQRSFNNNFSQSWTEGVAVLSANYMFCYPSARPHEPCLPGDEEKSPLGPTKVECKGVRDNGEMVPTNAKKVQNIHVKFEHCVLLGSAPCGNGGPEGQITTNILKGELGYIKKAAPKEVGVLLEPAAKKGLFAAFNCAGFIEVSVGGATEAEGPAYPPKGGGDGIISPITPINTVGSEVTQVYTYNEETNENIPNKFEGKSLKALESYTWFSENPKFGSRWVKAGESVTVQNHETCEYGAECEEEIKA